MKQLLELKEFETVIGNPDYKDTYKCMDQDAFADLIAFIHAFDADDANADVLDFIKIGYKRNVGETVTFKNYVGQYRREHGGTSPCALFGKLH